MDKQIPVYLMNQIDNYLERKNSPGMFLQAVITNNLRLAIERATEEELEVLSLCVWYFVKYAPSTSWGNIEKFISWLDSKNRESVAQSMRGMEGFVP